jgi:hypothetical protein
LDLKSRNKSIRLLSNRMHSQTTHGYNQQTSNLLREKNQEISPRKRITHPPPADLLLISQQGTTDFPSKHSEHRKRNHKIPNKENIENSQTRK